MNAFGLMTSLRQFSTNYLVEGKHLKKMVSYFLLFLANMNPHAMNTPARAVSGETGE